MEVGNGGEAGMAWEQMLRLSTNARERERIKRALLAYCRQDTWALVELLRFVRDKVNAEQTTLCAPVEHKGIASIF